MSAAKPSVSIFPCHKRIGIFWVLSLSGVLLGLLSSCGPRDDEKTIASKVSAASSPKLVSAVEESFDWSQNTALLDAPIVEMTCTRARCTPSVDYAWALENEFWRHLQREDLPGMQQWVKKTQTFVNHRAHRGGNKKYRARLMFLLGVGYSFGLTQVNFAEMAPIVSDLQSGHILRIFTGLGVGLTKSAMGGQIAQAMRWLLKSYSLSEGDALAQNNTRIAIQSLGIFLQSMAPDIMGMTGPRAVKATLYGPSCQHMPRLVKKMFGSVCTDNGLIGPGPTAYLNCQDDASCAHVGNGLLETFFGAASLLYRMHDLAMVETYLKMAGDSENSIAVCRTNWCQDVHPREPEAPIPEKSSATPFKRIVNLLAITEAYGKVGNLERMEVSLKEAYDEARRLKYPFMEHIRRIDISLHGGDVNENIPDIRERWANRDTRHDTMGSLQLPFPLSATEKPCASCHFGGVLSKNSAAIYGK